MFACSTILAVFIPNQSEQPALIRAAALAKKYKAELHLVSCDYDTSCEMTNIIGLNDREQIKIAILDKHLDKMKAVTEVAGIKKIKLHSVWHKDNYKGILDTAHEIDADLIVKSCRPHNSLGDKLFTPDDWHLLRLSKINVLMVKDKEWPEDGKIISALSIDANDNEHKNLNDYIAESSQSLAAALNAELHFANTFVGAPVHIAVEVPSFSIAEYNKNVEKRHKNLMQRAAEKFALPESHLHIAEGLPEDVLPELCEKLDAELLVVGSVGRKGLSAAILGNTAEHIIDKIQCDTLVIKHDA